MSGQPAQGNQTSSSGEEETSYSSWNNYERPSDGGNNRAHDKWVTQSPDASSYHANIEQHTDSSRAIASVKMRVA
jgi:hypothetical protein